MDKIDKTHFGSRSEMPSHTHGTPKGEELVRRKGREPGRDDRRFQRTARDSTSVGAGSKGPIDSRMPHMPPA